jgi:hypothetical protein
MATVAPLANISLQNQIVIALQRHLATVQQPAARISWRLVVRLAWPSTQDCRCHPTKPECQEDTIATKAWANVIVP